MPPQVSSYLIKVIAILMIVILIISVIMVIYLLMNLLTLMRLMITQIVAVNLISEVNNASDKDSCGNDDILKSTSDESNTLCTDSDYEAGLTVDVSA